MGVSHHRTGIAEHVVPALEPAVAVPTMTSWFEDISSSPAPERASFGAVFASRASYVAHTCVATRSRFSPRMPRTSFSA